MSDERLTKQVLFSQLGGARPVGRPPQRWREDVLPEDLREAGRQHDWNRIAANRSAWRRAVKGEKVNARALR